jgi:hypothetical protein
MVYPGLPKKNIMGVGLDLISVMMTARVFVSEYLQASFACWSHGYQSSFSLAKIFSATAIRNGSGPAMVYPGLQKKNRGSGTRMILVMMTARVFVSEYFQASFVFFLNNFKT